MSRKHPQEIAKDFKQFPFFKNFTDSLLLQVCTLAQQVVFNPGDDVLKQGQENDCLYFLNSGEVDVILDGELVTHLSRRGEVLGEMSVISQQPVSATIRATTTLDCYYMNANDFSYVNPKDKDHFQYLLYKIYADIVTDRLRTTNYKARQFEISNRDLLAAQDELKRINMNLEALVESRTQEVKQKAQELEVSYAKLEQQNAVLLAGFNKITEQAHQREKILDTIRRLDQTSLIVLRKGLEGIKNTGVIAPELDLVQKEVDNISDLVSSLGEHFQKEKATQGKRVLLVEGEKKQQLVAKMALGGTGVQLDIASDLGSAQALLDSQNYDMIFCETTLADLLLEAHKRNFPGQMVLVTSSFVNSTLGIIKSLPFVSNVVSRDVNDRTFTVKTIVTTITKILNRDYFGLEKYLSWGVDVQERRLTNSSQRSSAIEEMGEQLKSIGVRGTLIDRCGLVAEEMLMNAIYDAPTDKNGKSLFNHVARTEEIQLSEDQAAKLRFACDGNLVAVSVVDPFGSLSKKIIIDYLESCYGDRAGELNEGKGKAGAGRGLHQIIENADLTIFNVQKGYQTEVICLFNVDANQKQDRSSTFHYFFS
ncbi:MAG: hypothetical protein BroJett040_11470 [Oligoflexia bacterium]|nr:MAG: hypothetical protein BroJett040_11470 [Oligoflexia bacterium]